MLRAIKIRLYPNKEQELKLNKVLGCYRYMFICDKEKDVDNGLKSGCGEFAD